MKIGKILTIALASLMLFMYSCGNNNSAKDKNVHTENNGHNHSEMLEAKTSSRNAEGQLIDISGNIITGCPGHKEMIGSQGDMCPKCDYMVMIPITWDITGVDTVRVTTLPDYNPPKK